MENTPDTRSIVPLGRHLLERIVTSSSEPVLLLDAQDPKRPVVYANPAYESLSGRSADALVGRSWPLLEGDGTAAPEIERLRAAVEQGEACSVSLSTVRRDGTTWSGDVRLKPLRSEQGELEYLLCQHLPTAPFEPARVEVGLLQHALGQARQRIASLDKTDPQTGLLRYEHFMMLLAHDLGVARREGTPVSLLVFEIVELDVYRQTFGTKAADSCLRMIGAQVAGAFRRAGDSCARCDDAVIAAAVVGQGPEEAVALAGRVAAKVRGLGLHNPRARSARQLWVRHAVAAADPSGDDATALLARAKAELAALARPAERSGTVS